MRLEDKLYRLRKQNQMSQLELAETINVSRQAISKWEIGTAFPSMDNLLALSKLYGVSIDYLVNDDMASELEVPTVKATVAYYEKSNRRIIYHLTLIGFAIIIILLVGFITKSVTAATFTVIILCTLFLLIKLIRLLVRFIINRKQ